MAQKMFVRDLMTTDVITVEPSESLADVYDLMDANHIRHLPVVDADGELMGLVSHRDLLGGALREIGELPVTHQRDLLRSMTVSTIMSEEVETVSPDQDLRDAAYTLIEYKFGCLPVVEGVHLVGILTESDFVRHVAEGLEE